MHFRRHHKRANGARARSSDWRYQQIEKGHAQRGLPSTRRRVTAVEADLVEWMKDPEFAAEYNKARAFIAASRVCVECHERDFHRMDCSKPGVTYSKPD